MKVISELQRLNILSEGYGLLPLKVARDTDLSPTSKLLFGFIASHCAEKGYAFASNAYFAKLLGNRPETISRSIKELDKEAYITSVTIKAKGNIRAIGLGSWGREQLRELLIKNQEVLTKRGIPIDQTGDTPHAQTEAKKTTYNDIHENSYNKEKVNKIKEKIREQLTPKYS